MYCIVLVGGIPGTGKSELIHFLRKNKEHLYRSLVNSENCNGTSTLSQDLSSDEATAPEIYKIIFDEICSVEDQAEIVKKVNGWRHFRIQLLEAAERYMCEVCNIECHLQGPLSSQSQEIFEKLKLCNNGTCCQRDAPVIFLVEDNFYYSSMRYEWFQVAKRDGMGFCQVFVTCPLELALKRNQQRRQKIPEQRIKLMYSSVEYPDAEKNRWEKFSMQFDSSRPLDDVSAFPVLKLIRQAANQPAEMVINEQKLEAQMICSKNVLHQADRILRKLTGELIQELREKDELAQHKSAISDLVVARHKLFHEIKQGLLILPVEVTEGIKASESIYRTAAWFRSYNTCTITSLEFIETNRCQPDLPI